MLDYSSLLIVGVNYHILLLFYSVALSYFIGCHSPRVSAAHPLHVTPLLKSIAFTVATEP